MAGSKKKSKGAKPAPKSAFDENALSQLTAKIDTELSKPKTQTKHQSHKDDRPGKRKRGDGDSKDASPKKRHAQEAKSAHDKPKAPAKGASKGTPKAAVKAATKAAPKDKKAEMLEEIRLLGGDEADLDLVAGVDSDAEEGQGAKSGKTAPSDSDKGLKNELAKFAAGLGFEKVRDQDIATEDELEEEEEEEEEEAAEDEEWQDEPVQETKTLPAEKAQGRSAAGKLVFEPRPDWHAVSQEGLPAPTTDDTRNFSTSINALKSYAQTLLETDAAAYEKTVNASSTHKFMSTIMSSGTMSDKVSALTLAVQESPVHNIKTLESLMNLAAKKSREQAIAALGALVDLFGNGVVLPGDRRLRQFRAQPGLLGTLQKYSVTSWTSEKALPGKLTKAHLIMWVFEDWLKNAYFKIIQLLELWCGDEIEYSRSRSLDFVYGLLRDKPEQEANLLRLLVNKLGDREKKIASRASYLILQLLTTHPGMKTIVISTIETEILLRVGQTVRTKYYAINTLNQTILSSKDPQTADALVRIYFDLFVSLLKMGALNYAGAGDEKPKPFNKKKHFHKEKHAHKGKEPAEAKTGAAAMDTETAEKLVSAILTGVNRAVPFSNTDDETLESHLDTLFKITHSSNFNTAIQALMLVQQLSVTKHIAVDRFYRTLYESLLDPRLIRSSKQALYLNLLFRSLKNDIDVRRVKAFVKRMLQICHLHEAPFVCGILYLVVQLEGSFPDLKTLLNEPEEDGDDDEVYVDAPTTEGSTPAQTQNAERSNSRGYDGRKGDPRFSNAEQSCLWEVIPYFGHYHPSVSVFAANLLVRQKALPKPELANHTLINFLDKFVYKNPKAADSKRGASIMQPLLAAGSAAHIVVPGRSSTKQQTNVNSAGFWNKKQEDVAAEDVFFHAYFSQIGKPGQESRDSKKAKKDGAADGEDEDVDEDEIWDALVNSRPELEGDDADADLDMGEDDESDLGSLLDMSDDDDDEDLDMDSGAEDVDVEMDDEAEGSADEVIFSEEEEVEEEEQPAGKKGKGKPDGKGKMTKRELKKLPMFATADDYAALMGGDDDDDDE
ncbi:CBF/Mak21 family-domain-containing protein [Coniella lustricola]|uniref:CBF/Mak21 family-domain-containing protein n=1 Tax=Coniella lustricola TaxID=2025994 RepID=A0A2T3ACI5_9PEZI|nr:CBF/Mak21 family-domain-containing protein [Coniella lustricola]